MVYFVNFNFYDMVLGHHFVLELELNISFDECWQPLMDPSPVVKIYANINGLQKRKLAL